MVYQDECLVAINKPHGLLTHRSRIAKRDEHFALQILRDQINQKVYPVHRLDKKTSGVLIFALDSLTNRAIQNLFQTNEVEKSYKAIVRGFFPNKEVVDYPVMNARGKMKDAITHFRLIHRYELPIPMGKHFTSRYSLIEAKPVTGRMHQIRRHLNHLRHPIIGDRPHGCSKQNKLFKSRWNMTTMMLHAESIQFDHPHTSEKLHLFAEFSSEFKRMKNLMESTSLNL